MPLRAGVCQLFSHKLLLPLVLWFLPTGIDLPRGLLLYGVKGVGKSLLAQAVADKSGAHVINVASQQALLWYTLIIWLIVNHVPSV